MHRGYIKLWRKSLETPLFKSYKIFHVWIWCLMKATHIERSGIVGLQEIILQPGQFITGRFAASEETGLTEQEIRTAFEQLRKRQNLTIKSTNKYSIISIVKWADYQDEVTNNLTNKEPTNNQQITTDKHSKHIKKEDIVSKDTIDKVPYQEIVNLFHEHCPSLSKVRDLTDTRRGKIKSRWLKYPTLEKFTEIFKLVETSDFLTSRQNSTSWKCNFDWLFENESHIVKILEGQYANKGGITNGKQGYSAGRRNIGHSRSDRVPQVYTDPDEIRRQRNSED